MKQFEAADRISDRLIAVLNEENQKPDVVSFHLLAGVLLALKALERSMLKPHRNPFVFCMSAVDRCLSDLKTIASERPSDCWPSATPDSVRSTDEHPHPHPPGAP